MVTSVDGVIEGSTNESIINLNIGELKFAQANYLDNEIQCTDLFKSFETGFEKIVISFITAIRDDNNKIIGKLVARIDPSVFIYPYIESWPIPSETSESYVFKVESDSIVFLNNLKHLANTTLNFKISVKELDYLAAKAVKGQLGLIYGKDYRKVDVYGYAKRIGGTQWYIISKIDKSEMLEEEPLIAGVVIGFSILCIIIIVSFVVAFYNHRQKDIYEELYKKEKEIWHQNEKFKITMDSIGEGVIVADVDSNVQYMNSYAEILTGWRFKAARGKKINEIYNVKSEITGKKVNDILESVIKKGLAKELANHTLLISKNGDEIPVLDTGSPIYDTDGALFGIVITFQDETERRTQKRILQERESFISSILASINDHIAVIDNSGFIVSVNQAWETFAIENGATTLERTSVGSNYFNVCANAIDDGDKYASEALEGLKSVLNNNADYCQMDYPCHSPEKQRWFTLRASKLSGDNDMIVTVHEDITERMITQLKLMKSESNLREFFENDIAGDYSAYANGQIVRCNLSFAKILGFETPDELVGRNIIDFYKQKEKREYFIKLMHENKILKDYEVELIHKDGSDLLCIGNIVGKFDESGKLIKYFEYIQDKTLLNNAEKELYMKKQLLTSVMDTQLDLICRFLTNTNLTFVNRAFCKIFCNNVYEPESSLIGKNFLDLIPFSEHEIMINSLRELNQDSSSTTILTNVLNSDKQTITIEWTVNAIFNENGEIAEFQSTGHDITDNLIKEKELIEAKVKAEENDKLKTAFINNISHELRTPLNGILGFGQLLAEGTDSDEERNELFKLVEQSSNRLINTITDYIDMAMIFSGTMKVNKTEFSFEHFFEGITEKARYLCNQKNLDLQITRDQSSEDVLLVTDHELLQKVFDELIDNAIKFTKQGYVKCSYIINPDFIEVTISDTGCGIEQHKYERIFEMFMQADTSMTRGYEGSGLGLSIAKGIINLLGGNISLESAVDKGTSFIITIPLNNRIITVVNQNQKRSKFLNVQKPLILIAEDDELNYLYLEVIMKALDHDYIHVYNGKDAVDICHQNPNISLILMDIKMPVMNGVEALKLIRKFRPDIPVIAITAFAQTGDEQHFLSEGYDNYISKPIKKEVLI